MTRRPLLLLRSSWQTVNIGDIAHTPGVLRLLEQHLPEVEVRLWPSNVGDGVAEMLRARFPRLRILTGPDEISEAIRACDFMLHGSGPALVAAADLQRWRQETGKPYGIFGITVSHLSDSDGELLTDAAFAYFRDSRSLQLARARGVQCPIMAFGPDGAFATDVRDEAKAECFLAANGLATGRFLCCIPRYRFTPYWRITDRAYDSDRDARNEAMKRHDHAPLCEAIVRVSRETDLKILLCPEDRTQMAVGKEMVYDRLPEDVRQRVVWRAAFWLTDEALSTYVRSAGLFGLEMHSPIMCIGNGIPAIVCRFAEQTSKGEMWRDIGLGDWLFDMDQPEQVAQLLPAVLDMARNPEAAARLAADARRRVTAHQAEMTQQLGIVLGCAIG